MILNEESVTSDSEATMNGMNMHGVAALLRCMRVLELGLPKDLRTWIGKPRHARIQRTEERKCVYSGLEESVQQVFQNYRDSSTPVCCLRLGRMLFYFAAATRPIGCHSRQLQASIMVKTTETYDLHL